MLSHLGWQFPSQESEYLTPHPPILGMRLQLPLEKSNKTTGEGSPSDYLSNIACCGSTFCSFSQ